MSSELYIITVATEIKFYMKYLIQSVKNNGAELIILGLGEKWQGYNWRNKLVLDFISKLNNEDIICFVDGYDVICLRNLNNLIQEFNKIKLREKCKIIVGYENRLNFMNDIGSIIFFNGYYLNAGTYISNVQDLKEIISSILKNNFLNNTDDQVLLNNYSNTHPYDVYLDSKAELFLSIVDSRQQIDVSGIFIGNEIIYKNQKPFFIHGPANTCMDTLIVKMNLDKNCNICEEVSKFDYYKISHFGKLFLDKIGIYILIIILILTLVIKKY